MRYTVKDARRAFKNLKAAAAAVGFNTAGWVLEEGSASAGCAYRVFKRNPETGALANSPFRSYLGMTAREATARINAMAETLWAVADMNRYGRGA
jgi:hypothetical protein